MLPAFRPNTGGKRERLHGGVHGLLAGPGRKSAQTPPADKGDRAAMDQTSIRRPRRSRLWLALLFALIAGDSRAATLEQDIVASLDQIRAIRTGQDAQT